jgi:AraC family transcriptional regulator
VRLKVNRAYVVIEEALNYIENHLKEKITLEDIAQGIGISKYYLHRLFKSLIGETIIEYTKARKLASSVHELLNTNLKIIDIAVEYGFEYEQSYIRAFRTEYGKTPLKVRNDHETVLVQEKIDINEVIISGAAITYRPFFVEKPAFHLIGIKHVVPQGADYLTANRVGNDFFLHYRHLIKNAVNPNVYIGYVDWGSLKNGYSIYLPSIEVNQAQEIPYGMTSISIPTHKYAVFRFVGFFRPEQVNISHFYHILEYMYTKWIIQTRYDFAAAFRFEFIDNSHSSDQYCEIDIYQPVKNKGITKEQKFHDFSIIIR